MPINPVSAPGSDPIFRAQQIAFSAIRRYNQLAGDSSTKLNTGERIINPGDDPSSFLASRRIRAEIGALQAVSSAGQLNLGALSVAQDGLSKIVNKVEEIKSLIVQAQTASPDDQVDIQVQIDAALSSIDAAARNARFGGKSLLDGSSSIRAVQNMALNGSVVELFVNRGNSLASAVSQIVDVRVNRVGSGLTRTTNSGDVLSLNIFRATQGGARTGVVLLSVGTGLTAAESVTLRITGTKGSTDIVIPGAIVSGAASVPFAAAQQAMMDAFNAKVEETGVLMTRVSAVNPDGQDGTFFFKSVGVGEESFVKVEFVSNNGADANDVRVYSIGNRHANTEATFAAAQVFEASTATAGQSITHNGLDGNVLINGEAYKIGGEFGNTVRYLKDGFDIEIDLGLQIAQGVSLGGTTTISRSINIILGGATSGVLGASATSAETVQFGFRDMDSSALGVEGKRRVAVGYRDGINGGTLFDNSGTLGANGLADLKSGGSLDIDSGKFVDALQVAERALGQATSEQARLGSLQNLFDQAVADSQVAVSNLSSLDNDIIGVDVAAEIANFTQAQLGLETATSLLQGTNFLQSQLLTLLQ